VRGDFRVKSRDFRFEPILKYRTFLEEMMKSELAEIAEILRLEENKLFALEEIWRSAVEELKERQARQVPPYELFMYHTYISQLSLDIESQRKRVAEVQKIYHTKRESLIGASQEKKIVERLKERDSLEKFEEESRAEKKVMDETARNRYVRRIVS